MFIDVFDKIDEKLEDEKTLKILESIKIDESYSTRLLESLSLESAYQNGPSYFGNAVKRFTQHFRIFSKDRGAYNYVKALKEINPSLIQRNPTACLFKNENIKAMITLVKTLNDFEIKDKDKKDLHRLIETVKGHADSMVTTAMAAIYTIPLPGIGLICLLIANFKLMTFHKNVEIATEEGDDLVNELKRLLSRIVSETEVAKICGVRPSDDLKIEDLNKIISQINSIRRKMYPVKIKEEWFGLKPEAISSHKTMLTYDEKIANLKDIQDATPQLFDSLLSGKLSYTNAITHIMSVSSNMGLARMQEYAYNPGGNDGGWSNFAFQMQQTMMDVIDFSMALVRDLRRY